jgi:hypothetical protein
MLCRAHTAHAHRDSHEFLSELHQLAVAQADGLFAPEIRSIHSQFKDCKVPPWHTHVALASTALVSVASFHYILILLHRGATVRVGAQRHVVAELPAVRAAAEGHGYLIRNDISSWTDADALRSLLEYRFLGLPQPSFDMKVDRHQKWQAASHAIRDILQPSPVGSSISACQAVHILHKMICAAESPGHLEVVVSPGDDDAIELARTQGLTCVIGVPPDTSFPDFLQNWDAFAQGAAGLQLGQHDGAPPASHQVVAPLTVAAAARDQEELESRVRAAALVAYLRPTPKWLANFRQANFAPPQTPWRLATSLLGLAQTPPPPHINLRAAAAVAAQEVARICSTLGRALPPRITMLLPPRSSQPPPERARDAVLAALALHGAWVLGGHVGSTRTYGVSMELVVRQEEWEEVARILWCNQAVIDTVRISVRH